MAKSGLSGERSMEVRRSMRIFRAALDRIHQIRNHPGPPGGDCEECGEYLSELRNTRN